MDFSTKGFKNLMSDVTTVFTRAKQYAEETIGTAERTELDQTYETLAERADTYKQWTERIVAKLEAMVQPNPNMRYGEMLIERIGSEIKRDRLRNLEYLGNDMIDSGIAFGPNTIYGSTLVKVGKYQRCLGQTEKDFVQNSYRTIIIPLRKFLDEDMKTISKERKVLETKRLDLDVAKNRLRKAKSLDSQNNAERDLKQCQEEFDRQIEITKLLLEGISNAQDNHVRCLNDFVQCQIEYYNQCFRHMLDLQVELSSSNQQQTASGQLSSTALNSLPRNGNLTLFSSSQANTINLQHSNERIDFTSTTKKNHPPLTPMQTIDLNYQQQQNSSNNTTEPSSLTIIGALNLNENQNNLQQVIKRKARCLNNYKAKNDDELSLKTDEIIYVLIKNNENDDCNQSSANPDDCMDWMIGEKIDDSKSTTQKGKVPVAYLEILN